MEQMVDQIDLFGFDCNQPINSPIRPPRKPRSISMPMREPRKRHKLFFAIRPDADAALEISSLGAALDQHLRIDGDPLRPDRLHITLQVIGDFDEIPQAVIDAARRAGDAVVANAFDVVFNRAMTFVGAKAYVLSGGEGVVPVRDLWLKLGIELANIFPSFRKPSFTPHMTLSYKGRPVTEHPKNPFAGPQASSY